MLTICILSGVAYAASDSYTFNGITATASLNNYGDGALGSTSISAYDGGLLRVTVSAYGKKEGTSTTTYNSASGSIYGTYISRNVSPPTGTTYYGAGSTHTASGIGYSKTLAFLV